MRLIMPPPLWIISYENYPMCECLKKGVDFGDSIIMLGVFPSLPEWREQVVVQEEGVSLDDYIPMEIPSSRVFGMTMDWSTTLEIH